MRVLICAFACHPEGNSGLGSGEDILGWNIITQVSRYHRVTVIAHTRNRVGVEHAMKAHSYPNVDFRFVDLHRWLKALQKFQGGIQAYAYLWQLKAYFAARRLHRECKFDLFHHVTYANDWMASFIGALLPIPYVRGPGGGNNPIPPSFLRDYPVQGRIWERVRTWGRLILQHDPFFRIGQRHAGALLVCNRESFERMPSEWRKKALIYPVSGVSASDLSILKKETRTQPHERSLHVLSAGKLIRSKGFFLAIESFRIFANKFPKSATLHIVGSGPDHDFLVSLVKLLELQSQVRFTRWMPRDDLLRVMKSSDVFLFPSLRDGGGSVVVEALAAGEPVICLDVGGPGLHVTRKCGIKIRPITQKQTVEDLAAALTRLYCDTRLRKSMSKGALQRAQRFYRWDRLGEQLMTIYRQVVNERLVQNGPTQFRLLSVVE